MTDDPFAELGLERGAGLDALRAARRRLARELHPDHGGDAVRMQRVNAAYDAAVAETARAAAPPPVAPATPGSAAAPSATPPPSSRWTTGRSRSGRGEWEPAAFVVELPVPDAFDALLVVTSWIGELVADEPPASLEVLLAEPAPCWCRLELLPEGRSTSVGILVADAEGGAAPSVVEVRDTWVAHLNQLAHWERQPDR